MVQKYLQGTVYNMEKFKISNKLCGQCENNKLVVVKNIWRKFSKSKEYARGSEEPAQDKALLLPLHEEKAFYLLI